MIVDMHAHYLMHLLADNREIDDGIKSWWDRVRDTFEDEAFEIAARWLNRPDDGADWRVTLDSIEAGGVRVVGSALVLPIDEFDLDRGRETAPEAGYWDNLRKALLAVEQDLLKQDPGYERHVIVRKAADLDAAGDRVAFVHTVEGGFHLGPDVDSIAGKVEWLAQRGVAYITLAHLRFRGYAACANAIPILSDELFDRVFPQQDGIGLTALGEAAVRAMYKHSIAVDISHMRQDALDDTIALLNELDEATDADPRDHPLLATHVGHRDAGPHHQGYNVADETLREIARRGGIAGLLVAEHQLGKTDSDEDSRRVVFAHIDRIHEAVGSHELTAIGSDLDGFIKPTLHGIDHEADLATLAGWIDEQYPGDAEAILSGNALRVLKKILG